MFEVIAGVVWLLTVGGFLLYLREHDQRIQNERTEERKEWADERERLLTSAEAERATLLNRIQSPEVEVAKQWDVAEPASLPYDDDEAFNKYAAEVNGNA